MAMFKCIQSVRVFFKGVPLLLACFILVSCGGAGDPQSSSSSTSSSSSSSSSGSSYIPVEDPVVVPLKKDFSPSHNSKNIAMDTFLAIHFEQPPSIVGSGKVKIYRTSDDALVDEIDIEGDQNFLGAQGRWRVVNRKPLAIIGNELRIYPHTAILVANTGYSVSIPSGIFSGQVNGRLINFVDKHDWQFTTGGVPMSQKTLLVDDDGESDFRTVQGAFNFIMQNKINNVEIKIGSGSYYEMLFLRDLQGVKLIGDSSDKTRIFNANADYLNSGSGSSSTSKSDVKGGRSLFLVENTDLLTLQNLTLHNTTLRSANGSQGAQAETIYFNSSGRLTAKNTRFMSEQDTLLLKGFSWFYQSTIVGNVDFIWGYPNVALFEDSEIRSIGDSKSSSSTGGGYVLQARVENKSDPGFVFLNSRFTNAKGPAGNSIAGGKTYLARSGNSANSQSRFDNISFINCSFDSHIADLGWYDESSGGKTPSPNFGTASTGVKEFGSKNLNGQAISPKRHSAFYTLTSSEANGLFKDRTTIFSRVGKAGDWLQ